ncbi:MAG: hypothetical protein M1836_006763 [Candelina mexicana]|nr:MAG: hypothetical protein M1836_006763 [Candelina mexicana]
MAAYRSLQSICTAWTSSEGAERNSVASSAPNDRAPQKSTTWTPLWLSWLSDVLITYSIYWTLLATVPLDLLVKLIKRRGFGEDLGPEGDLGANSRSTTHVDRKVHFALHPRLPLLAVSSTMDGSIEFFDVESSNRLWTTSGEDELLPIGQATAVRIPSCMRFSDGDHLAIGHTDGTILLLKCRFRKLVASVQGLSSTNTHTTQRSTITLLPVTRRNIYRRLVGTVTNLCFSPKVIGVDDSSGWLAISTDHAGIWLWSLRTSQATRIVSGGGINPGCFSWISPWASAAGDALASSRSSFQDSTLLSLSGSYLDSPMSPLKHTLSQPTVQRLDNAFGTADDLASLNDYYVQPASPMLRHSSQLETSALRRSSGSLAFPNTGPNATGMEGRTLLTAGTKEGKITLLRIFHCSSMLRVEATYAYSAADIARQAEYTSAAAGSITNLAVIPLSLAIGTYSSSSLTVLATASADQSSRLHIFDITIPARDRGYTALLGDTTQIFSKASLAISYFAKSLGHSILPYWYPRPIDSGYGTGLWASTSLSSVRTDYLGAHQMYFNSEDNHSQEPSAKVLSLAANPTGSRLLVTIAHSDVPRIGKCLLFNTDAFITPREKRIPARPCEVLPMQLSTLPQHSSPQTINNGSYMAMLSPSELARLRREQRREPPSRVTKTNGGALIKGFEAKEENLAGGLERRYGRVAFGTDGHGDVIGAYVYEPASFLQDGPAVGLFVLDS